MIHEYIYIFVWTLLFLDNITIINNTSVLTVYTSSPNHTVVHRAHHFQASYHLLHPFDVPCVE